MSKIMTLDAIRHDRRNRCPDCCGRTLMFIAGEDMPCPTCSPQKFNEACRERRLDPEQFGVTP